MKNTDKKLKINLKIKVNLKNLMLLEEKEPELLEEKCLKTNWIKNLLKNGKELKISQLENLLSEND